jgi:hypothetical protein
LETENLNTERIYIDEDEDEEEKEEKNTLSFLLEKIMLLQLWRIFGPSSSGWGRRDIMVIMNMSNCLHMGARVGIKWRRLPLQLEDMTLDRAMDGSDQITTVGSDQINSQN